MLHSNIYFSFNDLQSQGYASFSVQYYLPLLPQSIFIDSFSKIERTLLNVDPKQNRVITTHGFRSTFRDWSADKTDYPREVCEHVLAHKLPDEVEAAYLRGAYIEKLNG